MLSGDGLWHAAGQDALEMLPRKGVLPLQEEGAGELQADADQRGIGHQHFAEGGDRLVEKIVAPILISLDGRLLGRSHSLLEQGVEVLGGGGEGQENGKGEDENTHGMASED